MTFQLCWEIVKEERSLKLGLSRCLKMATDEIESFFEEGKVTIPVQEGAETLIQRGYGTQLSDKPGLVLASWEALHLLANKRIRVIDSKNEEPLDLQSLFGRFRIEDAELWTKYLVYRDLRGCGYVVREGTGWGTTFRVYKRGTYGEKAAKYLIFIICEGKAVPIGKVNEVLRLVQGMKKELIVAVMDRRGAIIYYSLGTLNV